MRRVCDAVLEAAYLVGRGVVSRPSSRTASVLLVTAEADSFRALIHLKSHMAPPEVQDAGRKVFAGHTHAADDAVWPADAGA